MRKPIKIRKKDKLLKLSVASAEVVADSLVSWLEKTALVVTVHRPQQKQVMIEALFPKTIDRKALIAQLALLAMLQGQAMPKTSFHFIEPQNWVQKVQADYPPVTVGRFMIYGKHQRQLRRVCKHNIEVEATNAFGTGEHPTTAGCLQALQMMVQQKKFRNGCDLGCGSGVLALGAAKLCGTKMVAVDNDAEAVDVARAHVQVNGLQRLIKTAVSEGYRSAIVKRYAPYDLIMANIFARPLAQLAPQACRHLAAGGVLIVSGLMTSQEPQVIAAHRLQNLRLIKRLRIRNWSVLVFTKWAKGAWND